MKISALQHARIASHIAAACGVTNGARAVNDSASACIQSVAVLTPFCTSLKFSRGQGFLKLSDNLFPPELEIDWELPPSLERRIHDVRPHSLH